MSRYSLEHLSDPTLLRDLAALVARDRVTTADLLAHIAEVDARGIYRDESYSSMFAYCVEKLRLCEQAAYKRILAARAARRIPVLFTAVAEGRLHLSAVVLLAPHLTTENAEGLLAAATHQTKAEIERLLAERFPRPGLLTWVEPVRVPGAPVVPEVAERLSPGIVDGSLSPEQAPVQPAAAVPDRSRVKPLAAEAFALQCTLSRSGHDNLRYAQALLGHGAAGGDVAGVIERGLALLVAHLEKTKFAATAKPRRTPPRATRSARHIPARVKRAVWERDGGRCTFVSAAGTRCSARTRLEFDHIEEVARGGEASVSGLRLLCRAHNQYMAERAFGAEFMRHKRLAAAEARKHDAEAGCVTADFAEGTTQAERAAAVRAAADRTAAERARERDVVPWLRALGFSASQARSAAAGCEDMPDATLEERVKAALSSLRPRGTRTLRPAPPGTPAASVVAGSFGAG